MKNNLALSLSLIALAGCGARKTIDLRPQGEIGPLSHKAQDSKFCQQSQAILKQMGLDKGKSGLDQVVKSLSPADLKSLVLGAKIYRRATPSRLSSATIRDGSAAAIRTLESSAKTMERLGLVSKAPLFDRSRTNSAAQTSSVYPTLPPKADGSPYRIPEDVEGIPKFGIGYGQSVADAGFDITAEVQYRIGGSWYDAELIYAAVKSRYVLTLWKMSSNNPIQLDLSSCEDSGALNTWITLPINQTDMTECESKSCAQ